jgi:hypothetical protein
MKRAGVRYSHDVAHTSDAGRPTHTIEQHHRNKSLSEYAATEAAVFNGRCSMPHPHGTINRYNNQRCRCDLCRAAIRDYRRAQRAKNNVTATALPSQHRQPISEPPPAALGGAAFVEPRCGRCGSTGRTYVSQGLRWCAHCRGVVGTDEQPSHPTTGVNDYPRLIRRSLFNRFR